MCSCKAKELGTAVGVAGGVSKLCQDVGVNVWQSKLLKALVSLAL